MRRLFILRPEPGASASLERAEALGIEAVAAPLFRIEPAEWEAPDPARFDALVLTSANALLQAGTKLGALRGLPAYAVGEATAAAARAAGFAIAGTGEAGLEQLLGAIEPGLRLLHLAGEDRAATGGYGRRLETVTVYRAVELPRPAALNAIGGQVAAVHSPRAARRLSALVGVAARADVRLACISAPAAAAAGEGWEAKRTAASPSDEAVLALAASLCENRLDR